MGEVIRLDAWLATEAIRKAEREAQFMREYMGGPPPKPRRPTLSETLGRPDPTPGPEAA